MRYSLPLALLGLTVSIVASVLLWRDLTEVRQSLDAKTPHIIDVRFSQFMALHHRQAIAMSQLLLDGQATGLSGLAKRIASSQLVELGEMQGWLRLWEQPFEPDLDDMTWMLLGQQPYNDELLQYLVDCGNAPEGMPGLATSEQLIQLRELTGIERDIQYLRLMLAHHEGGLPMARFASEEATLPPVRRLARQIVLDQAREIQQFTHMLNQVQPVATDRPLQDASEPTL